MQPISNQEFQKLLERQDIDSLLALVNDLWEARGYHCESTGDVVKVRSPKTGKSERVAVAVDGIFYPSISAECADIVVAAQNNNAIRQEVCDRSATFVGPNELREMLLYSVDVDARQQLFKTYFDCKPVRSENNQSSQWLSYSLSRTVVTIVFLMLLTTVIFTGGSWSDAHRSSSGSEAQAPVERTTDTAATETATLPPGVNRSGVSSPTMLAIAHGKSIRDVPYQITFNKRIESYNNGTAVRVQSGFRQVKVRDTKNFRSQSGGNISVAEGGFGSLSAGVYADGKKVYRRVQRENKSVFFTGPALRSGRFNNLVQSHIITYLSTTETTLSESERLVGEVYIIETTGRPSALSEAIETYSAIAIVHSDGFVRSLNVTYTRKHNGKIQRVHFSFKYKSLNNIVIEPPQWYNQARNATAESSS